MNTQIVKVGDHQIIATGKAYENMLTKSGRLMSPRIFIAQAGSLTVTQNEKREVFIEGKPEQTTKDVRAMIVAKHGEEKGKALIKTANEKYDEGRSAFYVDGAKICALVGADATLRKVAVPVFNKKGVALGVNISARYERGKNASSASKIANLEATVAKLTAALGTKALEAQA